MIRINGYAIDVAVTEEHARTADVTEHEVELGANVADHIRLRPATVIVEGIVSDTPIGKMVAERGFSQTEGIFGGVLASDDAHDFLVRLMEAREPVTIITSLGVYENMALFDLSTPRSKETVGALRFRASFKEIRFVTNDRTTIQVSTPRAARSAPKGTKVAPDKPLVPTANQSQASQLWYGTRYDLLQAVDD